MVKCVKSSNQHTWAIENYPVHSVKKAEPFKQWLAMVGKQRLDEEVDPQIAIDRAIESYRNKGYSEEWIAQRMRGIEIRKDMTNEWRRAGITDSRQYASLTNILTAAWSGKTVKEYKKFKGLKKKISETI